MTCPWDPELDFDLGQEKGQERVALWSLSRVRYIACGVDCEASRVVSA